MKGLLEGAAFWGTSINEKQAKQLIAEGEKLLSEVASCAANVSACQ